MRDFFTALGLIWCLYNTWELRHNFKFDKMSNILDQATLKVLKIHCKRRALCKRKVRRNKKGYLTFSVVLRKPTTEL